MKLINAIGNTPLIELNNIWNSEKSGIKILVKNESTNPGGSVKDRPAYYMIKDAIDKGILTKNKIILEPTSGNTGIGLAMIAANLGYKIKLIMPECVSMERRAILSALGAELELTPGCEKTDGSIRKAHEIIKKYPEKYYMPDQFSNPANWKAHYETTAPEIIRDTDGKIDYFVAGMGTTGTLMGCAKYFKEKNYNVKVVGIEPDLNHHIQGLKNMNEAIIPPIYEPEMLDDKFSCSDDNAFEATKNLALKEGLFCGISSGAALWGALQIAKTAEKGITIVALLPDRGERYLSTELFKSICALCPP
jgi:S-sulfo-L-cysteine synthase (O-acetyl-L-serine-dependent)